MIKKTLLTILFSVALVMALFADDIIQEISAKPSGNSVLVQFKTLNDSGVKKYFLEKSVDDENNYVVIHEFLPSGGAGNIYKFTDEVVWFRKITSSIIFYRVRIEYESGQVVYGRSIMAVAGVNEIVKTWGSIKLLFR